MLIAFMLFNASLMPVSAEESKITHSTVKSAIQYALDVATLSEKYLNNMLLAQFDYMDYSHILPTLYLTGDMSEISKENSVILAYRFEKTDGSVYVVNGNCELKWQGASSLSYPKKNFNIKFDNKFEAKEGWGKQKKYCLKANFIDCTHARNVGSARLWGQIVNTRDETDPITKKLQSLPNGGAVDGFPVMLVINGEFYGLYTFNIQKDKWMFDMEDTKQKNQAILCADAWSESNFFKAPATLNGDFDIEHNSYEEVSDNPEWIRQSLNNLINSCIESDGSDLDSKIGKYLDWNSAIDYYIFTTLIGAFDCFGKNYMLSTYDSEKWFFSAYDLDTTFGLNWNGESFVEPTRTDSGTIFKYAERHRVMELILKHKTDEFIKRYWELREGVLSESNVSLTLVETVGDIPQEVYEADYRLWNTIPNTKENTLERIDAWYSERAEFMDEQIKSLE